MAALNVLLRTCAAEISSAYAEQLTQTAVRMCMGNLAFAWKDREESQKRNK
jgi:hypothetical protein